MIHVLAESSSSWPEAVVGCVTVIAIACIAIFSR